MSPNHLQRILRGIALVAVPITAMVAAVIRGPSRASFASPFPICTTLVAENQVEAPFVSANEAAMNKMMAGMAIKPTGDVDADFAGMMTPHHKGAIEMAEAELRFGHNERLRRIAEEIIVDQQAEIEAMQLALNQPPALPRFEPSSSSAPP